MSYVFDTSILVAREHGVNFEFDDAGEWAISAMTLAELNRGVLLAKNPSQMQRRLATYVDAASAAVLAFDEHVAITFAELVTWAKSIGFRPSTEDGVIAATAVTNGLTLVSLDQGFVRLRGFEGFELIVPG